MSHLIESYALASGLQIYKPNLYESYFPLPFHKYILIHAGGGMPAKLYDYYGEVIAIVRPILVENGYELLQIGGKNDPQIKNTIDLRSKTNLHQTAYLIHRASLLVGNDSCNVHFASGFDIPLIALYGPTSPKNSGPYFGDKSKQIIIQADLKGNKPSFNPNENPKTINRIKPEIVAQNVLDLLKIDKKINIETVWIGPQYNHPIIEIIMDLVIKPDFFQGSTFNARMDYLFNEEMLAKNLSLRPFCIVTEKPININLLKQFRGNVAMVIYNIDQNFSVNFVKEMSESAIPYQITSFMEGDDLNKAKLAFFDYGIIIPRIKASKEKVENHEKITKYSKYKTQKFLLSDNKIYLNKIDWMNKKPVNDFFDNEGVVDLENPEFFEERDWMIIQNLG